MMEYNINDFLEKQVQINNQLISSNQYIGKAIAGIKEQSIDVLKKELDVLKDNMSLMMNSHEKLDVRCISLENSNESLNQDVEKINKTIYTLEFDDTGKFNEYKRCAKARVYQLVGETGSNKHILFYNSFISTIHNHVAKELNVSRIGRINVDDFQGALVLAKRWRPKTKYIKDKIKEFQKLEKKKKVTEKEKVKINALEQFLEDTDGGNNIEF